MVYKNRFPYYSDDTDYTTNAPSYYEALARFTKTLRNLTERLSDVEQHFKDLILEWLDDGTLAGLLEQLIIDEYARKDWVIDKLNELTNNINTILEDYATEEWVNLILEEFARIDELEILLKRMVIHVTVGDDGDFQTVNEALDFIIKKPIKPLKATIEILEGFVMKEQISIDSMDLGYITLTSDCVNPVIIDRDSINQTLIESRRPVIFGNNNSVLPVIDVLFEYSLGSSVSGFDGITVANGSKVRLKPGSGVNKADRGLGAYYNSEAFCYMEGLTEGGMGTGAGTTKGVYFQNCTNRAFMATFGSTINCARSQLQNCKGDHGVYVIWNSKADIYQSDISGAENTAVTSRDGSIVNARETNVSNSNRGYHATHGGLINARSLSQSQWVGDSAKFCKDYGALASYGSTIELQGADVSNSLNNGIHASDGSTINAGNAKANKCGDLGVSAIRGSTINFDNGEANECTSAGILAESESKINANNASVQNSIDHSILARNGGYVSAKGANVSFSKKGMYAYNGSTIACDQSKAESCEYGYVARFGSSIDGEQASANNCSIKGFYAYEGSKINCNLATANNINKITTGELINQSVGFTASRGSSLNARETESKNCSIGVLSYEGSTVNATGNNSINSINNGLQIYRGSFLTAINANGSLSHTPQTDRKSVV